MTYDHKPIIVIRDQDRERANLALAAINPEYAATFGNSPLSPGGLTPATHWMAAPPMEAETFEAAALEFTAANGYGEPETDFWFEDWSQVAAPGRPWQVLAAMGLEPAMEP